jgi:hypothetical protein
VVPEIHVRLSKNLLGKSAIFSPEILSSNRDPVLTNNELFEPELLSDMRAAWAEVENADHFANIQRRIRDVTDQTTWTDHGLNGQQLRFKLAVIRFFHQRYIAIGGRRLLKKLLDIIDDLLDSILEAIGAGGAISEIKDFIKDSVIEES